MRYKIEAKSENGFSMTELVVAMLILLPLMGATVGMFSVGTRQQTTEQGSIDVNQDARAGLEMMVREISQAGAHKDVRVTFNGGINDSPNVQTVSVSSSPAGMMAGEWVDVDTGGNLEYVKLTGVGSNSISGIFTKPHADGASIYYFARPYAEGVIPPPEMTPGTPIAVQTLRFFGDINDDSVIEYVEYVYDSTNNQITRLATPVSAASLTGARPFIRNIRPGTALFTLNSNALGIINSVGIAFTVENTAIEQGAQRQFTALASRVLIQSAMVATPLAYQFQQYKDLKGLPSTPSNIVTWVTR
jgi:hypothetical protein